jgi:hypothetical protein
VILLPGANDLVVPIHDSGGRFVAAGLTGCDSCPVLRHLDGLPKLVAWRTPATRVVSNAIEFATALNASAFITATEQIGIVI